MINKMKKVIYCTALAILILPVVYNRVPKPERQLEEIQNSKEEHLKVNTTIDFEEQMKNPNLIEQHDPRLIKIIRDKYLIAPSNDSTERPHKEEKEPSYKNIVSKYVLKLLQNKTDGFFIECGANDGYNASNTFYMEKFLGWSGLLIKAGRRLFEIVKKNRAGAWKANTCLSPFPYPVEVDFHESSGQGGIDIPDNYKNRPITISSPVQCVPLYSLLVAVNQTDVDFFSLNIQGSELGVLMSIPWGLVCIKTLLIEHNEITEGTEALRRFMTKQGYKICYKSGMDFIFYHPQYITPPSDFIFPI